MGRLVITTNASLDGVVEDPDGKEGFRLGGWFGRSGGKDLAAWAELEAAEARDSAALLLGRRSDEWFAARWLGRDGERLFRDLGDQPLRLLEATTVGEGLSYLRYEFLSQA